MKKEHFSFKDAVQKKFQNFPKNKDYRIVYRNLNDPDHNNVVLTTNANYPIPKIDEFIRYKEKDYRVIIVKHFLDKKATFVLIEEN